MSVKRGLIGFGMSAAIGAGGGYAGAETFHQMDNYAREKACAPKGELVGRKVCENVIATEYKAGATTAKAIATGLVGTAGVVLGLVGFLESFNTVVAGDPRGAMRHEDDEPPKPEMVR